MDKNKEIFEEFKRKSAAVSTTIITAGTLMEAADYALRLCSEKVFSRPASPDGYAAGKVLAAPEVPEYVLARLTQTGRQPGEAPGVEVISAGLRERMDGIDVGFTMADMGIADTGTVVMRCFSEDTRLASMIAETHVMALPASRIVGTSREAEAFLREGMKEPMYTAFISGCSRTSDIERVLTLGVHGPLELHIVLTEEA